MAHKWWTLLTVCLGMLMLLIDNTGVNVALPSIAPPERSGLHHHLQTPTVHAFDLMFVFSERRR